MTEFVASKVPVVWAAQGECEAVYVSRFKHFWAINYSTPHLQPPTLHPQPPHPHPHHPPPRIT